MKWIAPALALLLWGAGGPAAAQEPVDPPAVPPPTITAQSATSTTSQRLLAGAIGGFIGTAAAIPFWDNPDAMYIVGSAYLVGSAGAIIWQTGRMEGARPLPVIAGTLIGGATSAALTYFFAHHNNSDVPGPELLTLWSFLVTVPLGGAIGHGM